MSNYLIQILFFSALCCREQFFISMKQWNIIFLVICRGGWWGGVNISSFYAYKYKKKSFQLVKVSFPDNYVATVYWENIKMINMLWRAYSFHRPKCFFCLLMFVPQNWIIRRIDIISMIIQIASFNANGIKAVQLHSKTYFVYA